MVAVAALVLYPLIHGFKQSIRSGGFLFGEQPGYVGHAQLPRRAERPDVARRDAPHASSTSSLAVSLELVLGIFVAVTLHRVFRGRGIVLAMLILPWALPSVVSRRALAARVRSRQRPAEQRAAAASHVISQPHVWLASGRGAIVYITLVHVWGVLPLVSLIFLAGLQSIPDEVYSASAVDGAGPVAAVPLHHAAAAAAVDRDRAHGRDAACDLDLRRDLRAERHRAEHALDPDPGLQHDVRRRPTSRTARRSRSCSPRSPRCSAAATRSLLRRATV